jgi:signal transduction histidine kinase/sensor domain CHASE-containing protein
MAATIKYFAVIIIAIAAGLGLNAVFGERHRAGERLEMTRLSGALAAGIEREISERLLITEGVAAAFVADTALSRARFGQLVRQLTRDAPDVINVAAAPDLVVAYVYPPSANSAAIGLDLAARPDYAAAIERSIRTGHAVVDGPFELVQGGIGFITRSAVMDPNWPSWERVPWGVISLVIDADLLFIEAGLDRAPGTAMIAVEDADGRLLSGRAMPDDANPVRTTVTAPGIDWTVSVMPAGGWAAVSPVSNRIWAGVLLAAAVAVALLRVLGYAFGRKELAEKQLAEAIDSLEDAFALYDANDRLLMCNRKYREFYAESADVIEPGARFEDIIRHGLESGQYVEAVGREEEWLRTRLAAHADPPDAPVEQLLPDGRWVRVVERRTESGNVVGFRVDISQLKEALRRSEAASAAKTAFLNTVSHELRTPLTVVLGYNAFLRHPETLPSYKALAGSIAAGDTAAARDALDGHRAELARFAGQIDTSGQHLLNLIAGILDVAAIDEGTLKINAEVVPLRPLIGDVIRQLRPVAERKGIELRDEGTSVDVFADPMRLRQILFNLVGNAVKFTERGHVVVRAGIGPDHAFVEVEDSGCGIAPEDVGEIFERFGQLDTSDARRHGGVGLGLAISRDLAELQGGNLSVRSVQGLGSVFRLELRSHQRSTGTAA